LPAIFARLPAGRQALLGAVFEFLCGSAAFQAALLNLIRRCFCRCLRSDRLSFQPVSL